MAKTELLDGPIDVGEDCHWTIQACKWRDWLSIAALSLYYVLFCDLDHVVLKKVVPKNHV